MSGSRPLALVHDYLTQQGGAERVVLALADAFPDAPLFTSLYDPERTFPGFAGHEIHTLPLDRIALLREHHRMALPLLAPAFSRLRVDADVVLCSTSGWAHGARAVGRKIVYCHTPARWLYQADRYLDGSSRFTAAGLATISPALRRWDRRAAASADRYLVNSSVVRDRVADLYGIEADVVPPPVAVEVDGPRAAPADLEPGFVLCVSRLLAYKNVAAVTEAFSLLPDLRLVVVGTGPEQARIAAGSPPNVTLLGRVDDPGLRWLYASCLGLVAASYEDFGLTPVEAAAFGRPTAALRWGGFHDTIEEGTTGLFFDRPMPKEIAEAVARLAGSSWDAARMIAHAGRFSTERFIARIREVLAGT